MENKKRKRGRPIGSKSNKLTASLPFKFEDKIMSPICGLQKDLLDLYCKISPDNKLCLDFFKCINKIKSIIVEANKMDIELQIIQSKKQLGV